ncbi:TlpA family protein disulfide reductase [Streptomyces fradiae]|uniref:TlpA family protein disulfide reductase n=1 Tax=Streptomyces fradiae TaxID=1906 RepID=UPI00294393A4|nr:TlpA disulfide reductase family protein [Streptomyces fradiae]WOI58831.1 TlpA disulfide reductase family protein [Streptomyces fradiae]
MTADSVTFSVRRRSARRLRARVLVSAACLLLIPGCTTGSPGRGTSPAAGFTAGDDGVDRVEKARRVAAPRLTGESLQGERIDLGDYRGKVVALNVWGSWCDPCRAEAPHFAKAAKELKGEGVEFVGINTRNRDKTQPVKFEEDHGVTYPSIYDPYGELLLRFPKGSLNPQIIPSTLVIDRDGRIAARAMKALNEEQLRDMLEPVLRER